MHAQRRFPVLVALALLLAGIGFIAARRDAGSPRTELLPAGEQEHPRAVAEAIRLAPTPAGPSGSLVLIQGLKAQRLVVWPLDGSTPPQEVDRSVNIWPLLPSPDGTRVLYGTQHTVMVLDVAARRANIVGTLPPYGRLIHAQWSPDNRALAYIVQTPLYLSSYYTLPDGSVDARLMLEVPQGLDLDVGWLPAGDPVSITVGLAERGGLQPVYHHFNPATGITTVLPVDTPIIQPWSPLRSPDGTQQIYATKTWDEARYQGTCRTGPLALAGAEWLSFSVRSTASHATVFEIAGLFMDRPTWLDDGRIVFRAVADPVCTTLESGFYVGRVGEAPLRIINAEPQYVADDADKLLWSASYALSPDQTRIAWNENDMLAQRSRIYVKPLPPPTGDLSASQAGNDARTLLFETAPPASDAPFAFQDEQMVLYFVWLP